MKSIYKFTMVDGFLRLIEGNTITEAISKFEQIYSTLSMLLVIKIELLEVK